MKKPKSKKGQTNLITVRVLNERADMIEVLTPNGSKAWIKK